MGLLCCFGLGLPEGVGPASLASTVCTVWCGGVVVADAGGGAEGDHVVTAGLFCVFCFGLCAAGAGEERGCGGAVAGGGPGREGVEEGTYAGAETSHLGAV